MMRKVMLLVLCGLFLGLTSPGCGTALVCSNNLDGSMYGFTLTVPTEFVCAGSIPQTGSVLAMLVYQQESTERSVLVLVTETPTDSGDSSDDLLPSTLTVTELGTYTSANDLDFERAQGTSTEDDSVLYVAAVQLPSGNVLAIFIDAPADAAELLDILTTIMDSVQLTGS
jgi:hypothetical protein